MADAHETSSWPEQDRGREAGRAPRDMPPGVGECVVAVAALLALIILALTTPHLP